MKQHFLLKHYILETGGRETRTAAFAKFFGRDRYYDNLGLRLNDPATATRLELIDRRTKEAAFLCPYKAGNEFRRFLHDAETKEELDERIRLLEQIVLQLCAGAGNFQKYSFPVGQRIGGLLESLGDLMPKGSDEIGKYHARVRFSSFTKTVKTPVFPGFPADGPYTPLQSEAFDWTVTTCTDISITLMRDVPSVAFWRWDAIVKDARRLSVRLGFSSGTDYR